MSRSSMQGYIILVTSGEDAPYKRIDHRRWRHRNKARVAQGMEPLERREVSNVWCWPSDGGWGRVFRSDPSVRKYIRK